MVTGELFLSYKGPGSELEILDLVRTITAVPASMVLTAVVRGCHALELKRIVMASPFPEDQDERLVKFLAHYGIEVVAFRGLGCPNADVIWKLPPGERVRVGGVAVERPSECRRHLHAM